MYFNSLKRSLSNLLTLRMLEVISETRWRCGRGRLVVILFNSLNCMLLKQLPVVIRFNIHSKGPALCTVVDEVSGYSILPCISFYFYF
jgi:hypothetical protein